MQFPYVPMPAGPLGSVKMPFLPVRLTDGKVAFDELALIDSGAALNVLPFDLGVRLGFNPSAQYPTFRLTGNLGRYPAKAVTVSVVIGTFPQTRLGFAWSQDPDARLLFGQVNFFQVFDVCFHSSQNYFEIKPKP